MPHLLIDRARHLPALYVHERDVHVRGRDGCCERLVPIGDGDNRVRLDVVEHRRQLRKADPGGLGGCDEVLSLEHHVHARRDGKAVALDRLDGVAVSIEERRGGDDQLQLELLVPGDRLEGCTNAGVTGTGGHDDADCSLHQE